MRWLWRLLAGVFVVLFRLAVILVLAGAVVGIVVFWNYRERALRYDLKNVGRIPERSAVYDTSGQIYSYIQGENRLVVPLAQVPRDFINALVAQEDTRFWEHNGVDFYGILRAAVADYHGHAARQGASTITQQLARNSFGLTAKTIDRKLLEAMLAWRIEKTFPKNEILQFYINRVYFGTGVYGVQRAAQVYFGKNAEQLTLGECAMLVGIIRSPNHYSPITNYTGAIAQRDRVLDRMVTLHMLTQAEAQETKAEHLAVAGKRYLPLQQSYVMDAVRRDLDLILTQDQIDQGGLKIYTTIDPDLQRVAEYAVEKRAEEIENLPKWSHPKKADFIPAGPNEEEKPTPYLQAAVVAIDNRTGAIRALVGGRDYKQSNFDRATLAKRQVGSTFKPFVYTTAFQRGLYPGSLISDARIFPGEYRDLPKNWSPGNSDGDFGGYMPAALGLIKSRNTMSVRIGEFAGLHAVQRVARLVGLGKDINPYPVIFLGGFETTLKDLVAAYTTFPNRGERVQSFLISRIENANGRVIFQVPHARVRVFSSGATWMTSQLMRQVLTIGTAAKAKKLGLTIPAAGKTGTTNDFHDAWFVGYTTSLTCGVWVGFDHPETIMEKGYGATLALPIWVDFMESAPADIYPAQPLNRIERLVRVRICSESNALATAGCDHAGTSYVAELPADMVPKSRCTLHDDEIPILAAVPVDGVDQTQSALASNVRVITNGVHRQTQQMPLVILGGRPTHAYIRSGESTREPPAVGEQAVNEQASQAATPERVMRAIPVAPTDNVNDEDYQPRRWVPLHHFEYDGD